MNFAESIKKARESGLSDDQILEAIRKQNPHKEDFFKRKEVAGFTPTKILDEMIGEGTTVEKGTENQEKKNFQQEDIPPEMKISVPPRPSEETKLWTRIFITLVLLAVAALALTVLYRAFFVPKLKPIDPQIVVREIQIPRATPPLVKLYPEKDSIERFAITVDEEYLLYLRKLSREKEGGEVVRIIVEDHREGVRTARITDLEDFFGIFEIDFPDRFFEKIEKEFNLFLYTGEAVGRLAFVVKFDKTVRDDVEWTIMRPWEDTMETSFQSFFAFWDEQLATGREFSNTTYKGEMPVSFPVRYKEGSGGVGIYYTITEDRLIFATSLDSIKIIIERYYHRDK